MIRYKCQDPGCDASFTKLFRKGPDVLVEVQCKRCSGVAKRILSSPASVSKISIDNGVQARAVEIYPDVEEIMTARSNKPDNRGD